MTPNIIDSSKPILEITPGEISINVVLEKEIIVEIKLRNLTRQQVAFKIKTTAPEKYQVRPIQSIVGPEATETCIIVMKGLKEYPDFNNPKEVKHKFLIQSVLYDGSEADLSTMWKALETHHRATGEPVYHDFRVPCILKNTAAAHTSVNPETEDLANQLKLKTDEYNGLMDFSIKQSQQIKKLKASLDEAQDQAQSTAIDLTKARTRAEALEKQLQELVTEQEKERQAKRDIEKKAANAGLVDKLMGPAPVPFWVVFVIFLVGLIVGTRVH